MYHEEYVIHGTPPHLTFILFSLVKPDKRGFWFKKVPA